MKEVSEKEFDKDFWSDYNELCNKCDESCKQSHKVIVNCPNYKGK